ncbi:MAG: cyclase family protein [Bacteroidota bacterium]
MPRYHDITMTLAPGMLLYPGDPPLRFTEEKSIARGDAYNLTVISFGSHTGTHIDAPKHFYDDGTAVDRLELDYFLGEAKVFEIPGKEAVEPQDLRDLDIGPGDRVLLKTRNSALLAQGVFDTGFTYLTPPAARYLADKSIRTLGFDWLSVEKHNAGSADAHYILLQAHIVLIEGLDLRGVPPGKYQLTALPLKIADGNGSPVRAVLTQG